MNKPQALPQRAIQALAAHMGITNTETIEDIKTSRSGDTYFISVTLKQEITQEELGALVR